ncbi:MAG: FAD binding domain-containing protein [Ktedonobacterales bacterium]
MKVFEHVTAGSVGEAIARLGDAGGGETRVIAGGTDLLTLMKAGLAAPDRLIDIKPAAALRSLRFDDDGTLRIGALTTLARIERDAELATRLPILPAAVRDAATPQLRAMATVGGNLLQRNRCWYFRGEQQCWLKGGDECFARDGANKYMAIFDQSPCVAVHPSDLAPALVALDASVVVEGAAGRRTLAVSELLRPPTDAERNEQRLPTGDLIIEVVVPPQPAEARGVYKKAMDRHAWAFALVSVAAQVAVVDGAVRQARIVLGGVANTPWRVVTAEEALTGKPLTPALAAEAAELAVSGATPLVENGYKVTLARELVRRALLEAAAL